MVRNLLGKVLYLSLLLFLVYLIFQLLFKLFGGSLGFEELVIGLLVANIGYSFYLTNSVRDIDSKISGHVGWHKGKDSR